jgi:uncharacterized protein (TIGR03435 family)
VDRTDLAGRFDVDLHRSPRLMRPAADPSPTSDVASLPDGPSLFTAVQEELGLKFEPRKEPMEVIVVDHIEWPTPD